MPKTIIVSAYAIAPNKGSEYGVGWNFVDLLRKKYKVIVVYGTSGDKLGSNRELLEHLKNNELSNVEFCFVKPTRFVSFIDYINQAGFTPIFYLAYQLWQKQVYKKVEEIISSRDIFLVHQLNAIGFREPGYLWKINKPFVWGPVGGTYLVPTVLLSFLPFKQKLAYSLRNYSNLIQLKYSRRLKKAFSRADLIFSSTKDDALNFYKYFKRETPILAENHIFSEVETNLSSFDKRALGKINLLWCGRVDGGKALIILIEALKKVANSNWHLNIIGDGPLVSSLKGLIAKTNFSSKITWIGQIERSEVLNYMNKSDIHILTSIKDANPTVLLEAMNCNLPTICLDHCGMSSLVNENTGIKIPVTTPENIIQNFASAIEKVLNNPSLIDLFCSNLKKQKVNHSWYSAGIQLEKYYEAAANKFYKLNQ